MGLGCARVLPGVPSELGTRTRARVRGGAGCPAVPSCVSERLAGIDRRHAVVRMGFPYRWARLSQRRWGLAALYSDSRWLRHSRAPVALGLESRLRDRRPCVSASSRGVGRDAEGRSACSRHLGPSPTHDTQIAHGPRSETPVFTHSASVAPQRAGLRLETRGKGNRLTAKAIE